mmetsp:Transcript_46401/g.119742  ORF Transcript_46401/g.119742 Transcript_46401/m.119742 type:complete len:505 (-) Transcript_46401:415-1929(-)
MSSSLMEVARAAHEENEMLVQYMARELKEKPKTHKATVFQEHRVSNIVDRVQENSRQLKKLYEDPEHILDEELDGMSEGNIFNTFYDKVRELKEYHRKHTGNAVYEKPDVEREFQTEPSVNFTGEEGYGRYLDLHALFTRFINLPGMTRTDYVGYLKSFDKLHKLPVSAKSTQYFEYVKDLLAYMLEYNARAQPLQDVSKPLQAMEKLFETKWAQGKVAGWTKEGDGDEDDLITFDFSSYASASDLEKLGMDALKTALQAHGLKCGGTLQQRAERLWAVKGKRLSEVDPKLRAKKAQAGGIAAGLAKPDSYKKELAYMEEKVSRLGEILRDQIEATVLHVQKKQASTLAEIEADIEELERDELPPVGMDEEDDDDDDEEIYNPKDVPLDWDGKPIPYWLYKLHGLNIEYKCEICGDFSYYGPRNFERHFYEWRHSQGMRKLGLPNTKHFLHVTSIEDAKALFEKLKKNEAEVAFNAANEEEYEDEDGNVFNRKTYEDLKRQGLI